MTTYASSFRFRTRAAGLARQSVVAGAPLGAPLGAVRSVVCPVDARQLFVRLAHRASDGRHGIDTGIVRPGGGTR